MPPPLLHQIAHDGSRQFAELPESRSWAALRDHLADLPGVRITQFLTDHITEVWIDFAYQGHTFSVNNPSGEYLFFVTPADCPEDILTVVVAHCHPFLHEGDA